MRLLYLIKLSFSDARNRPSRKLLLLMGIAIGVAVVVAVDLANDSISRSFQLSTTSVTGRATHQIVGTDDGVSQELYARLRGLTRQIAPEVTGYVKVERFDNRMMRLLGIDPFVDQQFRSYLGGIGVAVDQDLLRSLMTATRAVLMSKDLADQYHLNVGDTIDLATSNGIVTMTIMGVLRSSNMFTNQALSGIILTDIAIAQETLGLGDRLSAIDLMVDDENDALIERIQMSLPDKVRLIKLEQKRATTRRMSRAFELNLRALSLLALFVGMFLIYNTVTFSVVRRRFQIGTLRALGMTRGEVFGLILSETFIWGVLGTTLGLLLGIVLGTGMVRLVSRTISDLYFVLTVNVFHLSVPQLLKAFLLGILASVISALFPAQEAATINPIEALRRSSFEKKMKSRLTLLTAGGAFLILLGAFLSWLPSRSLILAFGALFIFVCGAALMAPWLTARLAQMLLYLSRPIIGVTVRMAIRNISRSLSRTGISIASLMIAISVIVGVDTMVGSFRETVVSWLYRTIRADIYIQPVNSLKPLDGQIKTRLSEVPGVENVFTIQRKHIQYGEYANAEIVSLNRDISDREWIWTATEIADVEALFNSGWVFVSETFAWNHHLKNAQDQYLTLDTDSGRQQFQLGGIFKDFTSDQGLIVLNEATYQQYWTDRSLYGVSLTVNESTDVENVMKSINDRFGDTYDLVINSNRSLRNAAIAIFDRTFTITVALRILAALVAFLGVMNTIMSLMMEREKEIGVLRANGLTMRQLWRMALSESGIIGLAAGLFAMPLGTALAWILVVIINKRSFGWTLEFAFQPQTYPWALILAVSAAILATIYPVLSIIRKPVAESLRVE